MDILVLLAGMIFCIWFGWHMREAVAKYKMQKLLELANQMEEEEQLPDNYIKIVIEKHNDMFFVYDENDNTFLAQAPSKEELDKSLRARFPGKLFAVKEENLIEVGFLS
jgi:murein L,D-transpeptidase YafK